MPGGREAQQYRYVFSDNPELRWARTNQPIQSHSWPPHLPYPEGRNGVGGQHRKGALLRDPGRDQEVAVPAFLSFLPCLPAL